MDLDFNDIMVVALGTALGAIIGKMAVSYIATTPMGTKLGMANFEAEDPEFQTI